MQVITAFTDFCAQNKSVLGALNSLQAMLTEDTKNFTVSAANTLHTPQPATQRSHPNTNNKRSFQQLENRIRAANKEHDAHIQKLATIAQNNRKKDATVMLKVC